MKRDELVDSLIWLVKAGAPDNLVEIVRAEILLPSPASLREVYAQMGKIAAIKVYRSLTDCSLIEAKRQIEHEALMGGWAPPKLKSL